MFHRLRFLLASLALPALMTAQPGRDLEFLGGLTESRDLRDALGDHLRSDALALLEARKRQVAALSKADLEARQRAIRQRMTEMLGGFPERTPLNARVTGTLERPGYRIEKILFESLPGFYVTANFYLPKTGSPPYPAILFPLGHEAGGKSNPDWQQTLGAFAEKGFAALTWDPLGQGERIQHFDPDQNQSKLVQSTTEHTILAAQCLLTGQNVARYTIWDGIRALDYLVSRPEVDASRIGLTGNSGGGTHTAYIGALEDRIHVAAPSCYLTSWSRLLTSIGPQDGEQNITPWIGAGFDHADFVLAFAPRPYLILSAIRDFFSISGARETFREARSVYERFDAPDRVAMVDADDGHGYTRPRRLAAYDWFSRWLKDAPDNGQEPVIDFATPEELQVTETGQVATSFAAETVFTLNRKRAEQLRAERAGRLPVGDLPALRTSVRADLARLAGVEKPTRAPDTAHYGTLDRDGYFVVKLLWESVGGLRVPALLFVPELEGKVPALVWVNGRGKAADASGEQDILAAVRQGWAVLAIDAAGFGETRREISSTWSARFFGDYHGAMTAFHLGRSLTGIRTRQVLEAVEVLAARREIDAARIGGMGREAGAIPLLAAAALDERIRHLDLEGGLVSYDAVTGLALHQQVFESIVPGALEAFDLPDLAASLAPRRLRLVNLRDPIGNILARPEVETAYDRARQAYAAAGAAAAFRVHRAAPSEPFGERFPELMTEAPASVSARSDSALAPEVAAYYAPVLAAPPAEFRAALNRVLRDTHARRLSYSQVWNALETTDEDPADRSRVVLLYTGRSHPKSDRTRGAATPDSWNREHVWPRSHGFPSAESAAHNDLHHLRPEDNTVNGARGNLDFDLGGSRHPECECLIRNTAEGNWEPPARVKGDIARMVFYMDVRYDGDAQSRTPDLVVVDRRTRNGQPQLGDLCTLYGWHAADPVDESERRRNDRVQQIQGNRNPFIDHPEWVARLWSAACP